MQCVVYPVTALYLIPRECRVPPPPRQAARGVLHTPRLSSIDKSRDWTPKPSTPRPLPGPVGWFDDESPTVGFLSQDSTKPSHISDPFLAVATAPGAISSRELPVRGPVRPPASSKDTKWHRRRRLRRLPEPCRPTWSSSETIDSSRIREYGALLLFLQHLELATGAATDTSGRRLLRLCCPSSTRPAHA